ncbi:MAG: type 1 glutamine amidotransferase [Ilumatobacteraceae bacterium]
MSTANPSHQRRRALAIAHHDDYDPGLIGEAAQRHGYELAMIDRQDLAADPDAIDPLEYDIVIPFGSAWSIPAESNPVVGRAERDLLRRAHEHRVPIFAICYGGQQLAAALGGRVLRSANPEIGWTTIDSTDATIHSGPWMEFHFDEIVPPDCATVLAKTSTVQAFRVGTSLGVQFHPEVTRTTVERWLDEGGDAYLPAAGLTAADLLADCDAHAAGAAEHADQLFGEFLSAVTEGKRS